MADEIDISFLEETYRLEVPDLELARIYRLYLQGTADLFAKLVKPDGRLKLTSVAFLAPLADRLNKACFGKIRLFLSDTRNRVGKLFDDVLEVYQENEDNWPADDTPELAKLRQTFEGLRLDDVAAGIGAAPIQGAIKRFLQENKLDSIAAIAALPSAQFKGATLAFVKLAKQFDRALSAKGFGLPPKGLDVLFSEEDAVAAVFEAFPALKPQLTNLAFLWTESLVVFYARLAWDWADVSAVFAAGRQIVLADIVPPEESDPHRRGKSVLILTFRVADTSDLRLVYKPGDVEIDYLVMGRTEAVVPNLGDKDQHRAYLPAEPPPPPKTSLADSIVGLAEAGRLDELMAKEIVVGHHLADVPGTMWPFEPREIVGLMELFNRGLRELDLRRYFDDGLGYVTLTGKPAVLALPTYRVLPRFPGSRLETLKDPPDSLPVARSYGYIEYLSPDPRPLGGHFMDGWFSSQKREFCRTWGRLQKISLIFSLSDRHHENLIVHDRLPCWIDLENTFIGPVETLAETGMNDLPGGVPHGFEPLIARGFDEAAEAAREINGALQLWMRSVAFAVARQVPIATAKFDDFRINPLMIEGFSETLLIRFVGDRKTLLYGEKGSPELAFASLAEAREAERLVELAEANDHDFVDYENYDVPLFLHRVADPALLDGRGVPVVARYFEPPAFEDVLRQVRAAGRRV